MLRGRLQYDGESAHVITSYSIHYTKLYEIAALGIGLAGGSFIIGVAYVSRWYDAGHQGTALGIFGAGNVGAAVTKFVAPFVMVAYGWHGVAYTWAAGLALIGVLFFLRNNFV